MPQRPHLFFRNPTEGVIEYRPLVRSVFKEENDEPADYSRMQENFEVYRTNLIRDRDAKHRARTIDIQQHIDYIQLHFFGPFDSEKFANYYRTHFGLVPVRFEKFNTVGLFAITNEDHFTEFLEELNIFINANNHIGELSYDVKIRYINEFYLLTNDKIISFTELHETVLLNLVESEELLLNLILPIETRLQEFLRDQDIVFSYNPINRTIQFWGISQDGVDAILNNFDIVHTVNSTLSGVIRPGPYGLVVRDFGFNVVPPIEGDPSIGILDTGVSEQTPLSTIILNRNDQYDLIGTGSRVDNFDGTRGHGTAVAGFAALGNKLIPDHDGAKNADAWIVSIKIFQEDRPRVADTRILDAIRRVNIDLNTKIFVLTISEQESKITDDSFSAFAYSLDRLAHELDILIFISSGNIHSKHFFDTVTGQAIHNYPSNFDQDYYNIKSPAESLNNMTVGACAANFEDGRIEGLAIDGSFPTIYTSKFHYNFHNGILNTRQKNKHLVKPDIIYNGGDWDENGDPSVVGLKYISARAGEFFLKNSGTSFSAPLMANLAARICKTYPTLRMQTVKALIISSAKYPELGDSFNAVPKEFINHLVGHGIPNLEECIYSDSNSVTMVLEDEILPDRMKAFELNVPDYLLDKANGSTVLDVKITMCFSFEPILSNQMAYCPIHISFGLFKNLPINATRSTPNEDGEEVIEYIGLNRNKTENIRIKSGQSWSEDYYFKMKLLSNTQKLDLVYNKDDIRSNSNKFKLAVNCMRHKLLNPGQRDRYNIAHRFSLVINIKERPFRGSLSGDLYHELVAINTLNAIAELEAVAEV